MAKKEVPGKAVPEKLLSKEISVASSINYRQEFPCWRINKFDVSSKWGVSALGKFTFHCTEDLEKKLFENESLYDAVAELDGKKFSSSDDMWKRFHSVCNSDIPSEVIPLINSSISQSFFAEKIYPKLVEFEKMTWESIEKAVHGKKGKTNSHFVKVENLIKEARERLDKMGLGDIDEIFSLRLEGEIRIYGPRKLNYMEIIWVDPNHEIYKLKN